jgi:hypothetical protein
MKATTYETSAGGTVGFSLLASWNTVTASAQDFKRQVELQLACSSGGRIVLHAVLALMTCRFAWHFQGIVRELTRS